MFGFGVGIQRLGSFGVDTLASLNALDAPGAGLRPTGFVYADPDDAKNGVYTWNGSAWQRERGLPEQIANLTVTGGTANAITAAAQQGVDLAQIVVALLTPTAANTGAVTLNGKALKDADGADLVSGALVAGKTYLLTDRSTEFRILLWEFANIADIIGLQNELDGKATTDQGEKADGAMQPAVYDAGGKEANVFDSANHDFLNSGVGPTPRSVSDRLRETLSVKDFGAVGDNSTDDTAAFNAAVANALLSGRHVEAPVGTFVTTGNIANFHDVRWFGPGIIKRGSDLFVIEPKDADTNRIYASAAGSNANDGLNSSSPVQTLSKIKGILVNTMPAQRGGTWEIKFAAGTYSDSTNFPDLPFYRNAIRFIGAGTSRTPQTIFDGTAAAYQTAGMYFQNRTKVYLQYIKFQDFTSGYGLLAEHNCQVELVDCDAENCGTGFAAGYSSFIRTTRCLALNCSTGFRAASNGQGSFAPSSGSIADSNRAYSCVNGFVITRMSYGHIDYNEIEDCTGAGIHIEINSRSAAEGNNFKRNAVAIRGWTSGYVSLNAGAPNTYNQASGTSRNTELYEFRGSSGIVNDHGQIGTMDVSLLKSTTAVTVTGTLTSTQIGGTLYTADGGWFIDNTKRVKFRAWGVATTPADGTILLSLRLAAAALTTLSIPVSVAAQPWCLEVEVIATASNAQKTFARLTYGGGSVLTEIQTDAVDCLSADRAFTFFVDPNGAGGTSASITVESMELTVCG